MTVPALESASSHPEWTQIFDSPASASVFSHLDAHAAFPSGHAKNFRSFINKTPRNLWQLCEANQKNKKNHAVSRLGNFGVEDDNSWEKKVFFECNKKKTAMNKQKFLKFTWRSLNITLAGRYHGEVSPFALLSRLAVSFRINLYQIVKFKRKTPWDSPPLQQSKMHFFISKYKDRRTVEKTSRLTLCLSTTYKKGWTHTFWSCATRKQYPRSRKNNTKENHARLKKITQLSHRSTSKSSLVPGVLAIVLVCHPRRKEMFPAWDSPKLDKYTQIAARKLQELGKQPNTGEFNQVNLTTNIQKQKQTSFFVFVLELNHLRSNQNCHYQFRRETITKVTYME